MKTIKTVSETEFQDICRQLVRAEVGVCVSALVGHFAQNPDALENSGIDYDEITGLCQKTDWEEPALEYLDTLDDTDEHEFLQAVEYHGIEYNPADICDGEQYRELLRDWIESDTDNARDFCDFQNLDPHTIEIYEHWVVSDYLAARLEERGEVVARDFFGLTVWGRATTGQSILLDGVIQDIVREAQGVESDGRY